jgi:hypothetical protein
MSGSWTKTQPPTARERRADRAGIVGQARGLSQRLRVIVSIAGVATKEFDGEAWAIKAIQIFDCLR